ncbi:hypothetical protein CAPTEDRAFT_216822 [Capitella teleta]|uniref:Uncharacterized protein n=1 Tax=Capitella teleta TaxID=283909 RepID=R7USG5_CAPTE|nr:hypothetical protein CAPTEDRAFT_216822 [Capitella teleta]|eukprot:ELU09135.1 hypothetical protein CAPTEDRAFT_216822 [Capitella teleta]
MSIYTDLNICTVVARNSEVGRSQKEAVRTPITHATAIETSKEIDVVNRRSKMGIEDVGNTPRHNSVGMKEHELCDFKQGEFLHVKNVRATEKRFGLSIVWCTMNDANDLL